MKKCLMFCLVLLSMSHNSLCQCDTSLNPDGNPKIAYKFRGNRCEGAYTAQVGAPSLEIISFTIGKFIYKLESSERIVINNLSGNNLLIRASAIPINTYYRMDASLEPNQTFLWEIKDILLDLNIPSNSLGVYGWTGTESNKLFFPVKPVTSISNASDSRFYLLLRPGSNVMEVQYRYAKSGHTFSGYQNSNGTSGKLISIVLPENLHGQYTIEVAAKLESGNGWVVNQYQLSIR